MTRRLAVVTTSDRAVRGLLNAGSTGAALLAVYALLTGRLSLLWIAMPAWFGVAVAAAVWLLLIELPRDGGAGQ